MNTDELKAGRELDALVAEKVMGACLYPGCYVDENTQLDDRARYCHELHKYDCPQYSTDIAAAWEVFDWLSRYRKEIPGLSPEGYSNHFYKPWLRLDWYEHDDCASLTVGRIKGVNEINGADNDVVAQADTIPLAICRAALMVVAL